MKGRLHACVDVRKATIPHVEIKFYIYLQQVTSYSLRTVYLIIFE